MQLTVLGCYGPYPKAGAACSGYLLQMEGTNLLLDCGNGVLSRLQEWIAFHTLDAVILSHLHADHISDLMIMRYGLEMAFNEGLRKEPLPLFAPGEPESEYARLPYKHAYEVVNLGELQKVTIGPFSVITGFGVHAVPSLAVRIESSRGILTYSGDTEYNDSLLEMAKGADLFLCEANYLNEDIELGLPNHLSSAQAARAASAAGVKRLILTHHHPERDLQLALAEAEKYFPGAELAREGARYSIGII
ncbi:MAG: MBL fold metallo-hydrolase [Bacillota bacterium]|nr:MBL fold metallo-hydrolase [Bacillota bacterium]